MLSYLAPLPTPARTSDGNLSVIGDSISTFIAGGSIVQRAANRSGRYRVNPSHILGVGGTRTDQILATVPAAVATGVRRCVVNGGTNDIAQGIPVATARANLIETWRRLRASGVEPVDLGMLPNQGDGTRHKQHAALQLWRQLYCAREGIAHANGWPSVAAAGGYAPGMNVDGVHPSALGIDAIAGELQAVLDNPGRLSPFGALLDETTDANGLLCRNAVSFGGVGTAVPTSWFAVGSGATYAVEAATDGSFGNWLSATFTGPVTNVGFQGSGQSLSALGWTTGDRVAIGCRVRSTGCTPGTLKTRVFLNGGSGSSNGFLTYDEDQVNGLDQWLYTEATVGAGPCALMIQATTTGTAIQKVSIQRPVVFNMTQAGL